MHCVTNLLWYHLFKYLAYGDRFEYICIDKLIILLAVYKVIQYRLRHSREWSVYKAVVFRLPGNTVGVELFMLAESYNIITHCHSSENRRDIHCFNPMESSSSVDENSIFG